MVLPPLSSLFPPSSLLTTQSPSCTSDALSAILKMPPSHVPPAPSPLQLAAVASADEKLSSGISLGVLSAVGNLLRSTLSDRLYPQLDATPKSAERWLSLLHQQASAREGRERKREDEKEGGEGMGRREEIEVRCGQERRGGEAEEGRVDGLRVSRTASWVEQSSRRLVPLLGRVVGVAGAASSWRVRYRLVGVLRILLVDCGR